jgi:hypothetical protein
MNMKQERNWRHSEKATTPASRGRAKYRGVHSVHSKYQSGGWARQVTEGLSLCFSSHSSISRRAYAHGRMDPTGFRTRSCDLDRVLCCHYTTGPGSI